MARLIRMDARWGDPAHYWWAAGLMLATAVVGFSFTPLLQNQPPVEVSPPSKVPLGASPVQKFEVSVAAAPVVAAQTRPAIVCPLQAMELTVDAAAPAVVCVSSTQVHQTGSVRSYRVQAAGGDGWSLRLDTAAGEMVRAELASRDGQRYECEASKCVGFSLGGPDAHGARSFSLRSMSLVSGQRLAAPANQVNSTAMITARLMAPPDDQVPGLACTYPNVAITSANGSLQRFCGQGGAGFEMADDGSRNFRFQDHENRTLTVSIGADQQVTGVQFEGYECRRSGCSGVSSTSAAPGNDMAARSFFFGKTVLKQAGAATPQLAASAPQLIVDGTLIMPSQE